MNEALSVSHLIENVIESHFDVPTQAPRTCEDAASRRGIRLDQELKTLVLEGRDNLYVIHLPGNRSVVFKGLRPPGGKLQLLKREKLREYGLDSAQVNPINVMEKIKNIAQVFICDSVFANPKMYTNNGRRGDTLVLATNKLPDIADAFGVPFRVGRFSKPRLNLPEASLYPRHTDNPSRGTSG